MLPARELVWEEVCEQGRQARRELDRNRWIIGDLALSVETVWGEHRLADFAREINLSKRTVERYRQMSAFYPASARTQLLDDFDEDVITHTHFREAMKVGDLVSAIDVLEQAAEYCWTTDELAVQLGSGKTKRAFIVEDYEATARISYNGKQISLVILLDDESALPAGAIETVRVSVWRK